MGFYKNFKFPFQLKSAGLLDPYHRSKNGKQYLLVVANWFTKFVCVLIWSTQIRNQFIKYIENQILLM